MDSYIQLNQVSNEAKVAFYKKTYSHVAGGVLAFILIEAFFINTPIIRKFALSMTRGSMWLLMLGGFMLVTSYAQGLAIKSHDRNKQYLGFGLYIVAEAFIFLPLIYVAMARIDGPQLINQAALLTLSLFTGLSAVVLITKKDFSFLRSALTVGFFIAIGLIIAGILFGFDLGLWFSVGMVVLAAGSTLYQTSNLVHKYSNDQYVSAALGLFASLMLLFWYILRIISRD